MDRRQRKTRAAIFEAFSELLAEKNFNRITVGEIIERADVGRATFYAHFETKDHLLRDMCDELFSHIFEAQEGNEAAHTHIFDCEAPDSVFLHLLQHIERNDNNILKLLSGKSNELFLRYFEENVRKLSESQINLFHERKPIELPEDFWREHISSSLINSIRWWISRGMKESPETVTKYFLMSI